MREKHENIMEGEEGMMQSPVTGKMKSAYMIGPVQGSTQASKEPKN